MTDPTPALTLKCSKHGWMGTEPCYYCNFPAQITSGELEKLEKEIAQYKEVIRELLEAAKEADRLLARGTTTVSSRVFEAFRNNVVGKLQRAIQKAQELSK